MRIFGLTGVARCGKDSFCRLGVEYLFETRGWYGQRYALADELKADVAGFIRDKVGIDVATDDPNEKALIRPLLVEYGRIQRIKSEAQYWTSKVGEKIEKDKISDVVFITDVRYTTYPKDEIYWLQNKMDGKLIHISQYNVDASGDRNYLAPPNKDEAENDPVLKANADYHFEWKTVLTQDGEPDWVKMKKQIGEFLDKIL